MRIANDSEYDLAGCSWAGSEEDGLEVARSLRTGMVSINGAFLGFQAPFGGYKNSGIGREFGIEGIGYYSEHKAIGV